MFYVPGLRSFHTGMNVRELKSIIKTLRKGFFIFHLTPEIVKYAINFNALEKIDWL